MAKWTKTKLRWIDFKVWLSKRSGMQKSVILTVAACIALALAAAVFSLMFGC